MATEARKARQTAIAEGCRLLNKPKLTAIAQEHNLQPAKMKALEALNDGSYSLSWSMCTAHSRNNKNALCNYRRKQSKVKKLHDELTACVDRSTTLKPWSCVSEFPDVVKMPYVLSVEAKRPNELKKLVRQAIMNEFWSRTLKREANFSGCGIIARNEDIVLHSPMMVASYHMPRLILALRKIGMLNYQMKYQHLILINSNNNFSNFKLRCEKLKGSFMGPIPSHKLGTGEKT